MSEPLLKFHYDIHTQVVEKDGKFWVQDEIVFKSSGNKKTIHRYSGTKDKCDKFANELHKYWEGNRSTPPTPSEIK